jgi:CDP-glucose 4,6-dehydratase
LENLVMFGGIYQDKRVLITGHTGFKGSWLSLWLYALGAKLSGFALPPLTGHNLYSLLPDDCFESSVLADLRDAQAVDRAVAESGADIIFHMAAQPIVGVSYRDPLGTFTTNALGTALLLEAVRKAKSGAALVIITSDKCYRNDNAGHAFVETDSLGGHDVYSMSKAAAELIVASWHASFFAGSPELGPLATGRAGNVIGGGDYAEDRIIPDAIRAFERKQPLVLRRPQATRPWQHVLESISGYLTLGHRLMTQPDQATLLNYNFGPDADAERSVQELLNQWLEVWSGSIDLQVAAQPSYSEATRLSLDPSKAKTELGWKSVWDFGQTVKHTAEWYRERHERRKDDMAMLAFSLDQIAAFSKDASSSLLRTL